MVSLPISTGWVFTEKPAEKEQDTQSPLCTLTSYRSTHNLARLRAQATSLYLKVANAPSADAERGLDGWL